MTLTYAHIEELFNRYRAELTRRLLAMVNSRDLAADLVQETYLKLLGLVNHQAVEHPRALLFRTASNLAIDHLRKRKVESRHFGATVSINAAEEVASPIPTPERELWGKQQLECVQSAIESLPAPIRETFLLHRLHGHAYHEIAAMQGISESAVDKRMNRALRACWAALQASQK